MNLRQFLLLFIACISTVACSLQGELELIDTMQLDVPEASGLSFKDSMLCVVSDQTGDIYLIDMNGKTQSRLKTKTKDVEGIAWWNGQFLLADESKKKIYYYNLEGDRLKSKELEAPRLYDPQSGLEGLCFDSYSASFFVINEKKPGQLLRFDTKFELLEQKFLSSYSDYSGVATSVDHIWVISDEGKGVAQYDRSYNLVRLYSVDVDKPEGIAISEEQGKIFIVSDSTSKLYVYSFPKEE